MKRKVKGIVMEKYKNYIIILTPEGDYLKVSSPAGTSNYGDEVSCNLPVSLWPKMVGAAASVAAVLLVVFYVFLDETPYWGLLDQDDMAHGYLFMDMNPGVELVFDEEKKVLSYRALDGKDELLLEGLPEGEHLFRAVELILERGVSLELMVPEAESNLVLVTLVEKGSSQELDTMRISDTVSDKLSSMDITAYVGVFEADEPAREEAREKGISLNRYLLVDKLQKQGKGEIKGDAPMMKLFTELKELPSGSVLKTTGKPDTLPEIPVEHHDEFAPGLSPRELPDTEYKAPEEKKEEVPPKEDKSHHPDETNQVPAQEKEKQDNQEKREDDPPSDRP